MTEVIKLKQEIECLKIANKRFFDKFERFYLDQIYNAFYDGEDIVFKALEQVRVGDTLEIKCPNGDRMIRSKRLADASNGELDFLVSFDPKALLVRHYHGDCNEAVSVVSGGPFLVQLTNKKTGETKEHTLHEKGATLMVSNNTEHQFTNLGETEGTLTVKFLKL